MVGEAPGRSPWRRGMRERRQSRSGQWRIENMVMRNILRSSACAAAIVAGGLTLASCQRSHPQPGAWSSKGDLPPAARAGSSQRHGAALAAAGMAPLPVRIAEGAAGLRHAAIELLLEAVDAPEPLLRANAIEALHYAPDHLPTAALRGLGDPNRGVRFIAAMSLGKFRLSDSAHLLQPLLRDESDSVRAAAIYAVRRAGGSADLNPLAAMVASTDPEVKANAAMVLGELGNASAVHLLRSGVGRGTARVSPARARIVDLQFAEAMVRLGDERQIDVIRAALFAPVAEQGEIVALACLMCGRLRDERAAPTLLDFATRSGDRRMPAEIRMAAVRALAEIDPPAAPMGVALEYVGSDRAELRAQAAMTLAAAPTQESLAALRGLLYDAHPMVQISAAAGILQITGG
jgi:HEAT repeat protein